MIQHLFSFRMKKRIHLSAQTRNTRGRSSEFSKTLHIEFLEARYAFSAASVLSLENWQSAVFDAGVIGTLPLEFTRNNETVDPLGNTIGVNNPRFGDETLLSKIHTWSEAYGDVGESSILGSGWDHDGVTPLAILWDVHFRRMQFLRGENFALANSITFNVGGGDLLKGTVSGYRYIAQHAVVHEGLVVVICQRERRSGADWIVEGVSFVYTQDLGQTFTRVAQVGGGFDVPAIAGGVTDGIARSRSWSFTNAFPEKDAEDMLGAWFPWADYLSKSGDPKGGQIGLFRARRSAVGEPWVVEANRTIYETWRLDDVGGFHAHTAGMFVDGMASFWGDVGYRNRVVRHIAENLENYTTTTWTHQEDFQGGWSPAGAEVYSYGNQAVSAAPGKEFGDILVAGDEQPESIMKVERPNDLGDKAVITTLRGSFPGVTAGNGYAGRLAIWLQYIRGVGYISKEYSSIASNIDALHFSVDGEDWVSLLNLRNEETYIYGNQAITLYDGKLHALKLPKPGETRAQAPLLLNPGGYNLATVDWNQIQAPAPGNTLRRVLYVDGQYIYADNSQPLDVQPVGAPPVVGGMPLWEITSDGSSRALGDWDVTGFASLGNKLHWLSAWHYSLDGNGIAPQIRISNVAGSERQSVWYSNNNWVPTLDYAIPNASSTNPAEQQLRLFDGSNPAPRRWLMAMGGFTESTAPTYPLAPDSLGSNEIGTILLPTTTTTSWSTALTFGLSEISSFSSYFDAVGSGTVHTIASFYKNSLEHIDVTFTKTTAAAGVLSIDVYSSGLLLDKMSFKSIYWDREDQVRLVISNSSEELGVSMLVTRNGYGMDSKSLITSGTPFIPTQIRLSNAARTEVTPLEWYAIQFNSTQALTTSERESFIVSTKMFTALDISPRPGPLGFDADEDMDGRDFLIWQRGYGIQEDAVREDGDGNTDGRVDGLDLAVWQAAYGLGGEVGPPTGDFNNDGMINSLDLVVWQEGYGIAGTAGSRGHGDGDGDGDVDGRDFLFWQRQYNGEAAELSVDVAAEPSVSDSETVPAQAVVVEVLADEVAPSTSGVSYDLQESDEVGTLVVELRSEQESVISGVISNFWLSPLPVVSWDVRKEHRLHELVDDTFALREMMSYQLENLFPSISKRTLGVIVGDSLESYEEESLPDESIWSVTADLAVEDWQTF